MRIAKALLSLSLGLSLFSCTKPSDILDDFEVHVNPTFYRYIAISDLVNGSDSSAALPSNISIKVSGPDAEHIYALDGTRNIKANGGIVQLMVPTEFEPQAGNPLRFNLTASAPGFLRSKQAFSIEEGKYYQSNSIALFDKSSLPANIAIGSSTFATDPSTGYVIDTVNVAASTGSSEVNLSIPPGMRFMDSDGNIIVGKTANRFEIEIINGDVFLAVWDGAIDLSLPTSGNEVSLGEGEDFSFGVIDSDGEVTQLLEAPENFNQGHSSDPKVRINIGLNLFNPETLQKFKKGDRLGVKYFKESTQTWTYISQDDYFIQEDDQGVLFVEFPLPEESYSQESSAYKLWYSPKLSADNNYTITTNLADANVPAVTGNLELVFELLNTDVRYTTDLNGSFNFEPTNGSGNNPSQEIKTLHPVILKEIRPKSGALINSDYVINAVETSTGWHINIDYNSTIDPVTLSYRLRCDGALIQPPVGVVMYYREHDASNTTPYSELYRFVNNTVTQYSFTQLEDGSYYDFRAQYGGDQVDTANVKVIDGHTYDIGLPQSICNRIGF